METGAEATTDRGRLERLRAGVSRVRGKSNRVPVARWLMIAGGGMVAIGVLAIVLGWMGASRTPYVFEQVPYLISGGLLGAALAILGGLFYFGYWMSRNIEESHAQAQRTHETLERIERLLAAGAGLGSNGTVTAATPAVDGKPFMKTARGTMFHTPGCVVVAGRDDLTPVAESGDGFEPCKICSPLATV